MTLINRLLNTSSFGLPVFTSTGDGAGAAGTGELAAPAAASGETPPVGTTENVASTPDPDEGDQFQMPSDEALFALDESGEVENIPSTPTPKAGAESAPAPAAGQQPPAQGAPAAAQPGAATPPQAGQQPPVQPQPGAPAASGTQPPAQAQQPPAEQQPPTTQAELPHQVFIQAMDANKEQFLKELTGFYAVSDADAEKMGVLDGSVLSGLAANLHYNVMRSATQMMLQTLGPSITQIMDQKQRTDEFISKFYKENPELNRDTDHKLVTDYATMYWKQNPQGTAADMIKQVGTMAKAHLGKLVAQAQPPAAQPPSGVAPKKVPPKMQPSFTPASAQGAAPAAGKAAPQPGDVWGAISDHLGSADDD